MKTKPLRASMGSDFTDGAILPMLFRFFLPFLLANLLNSIYNTVDTVIVGQFVGSAGIVAVTTGGKMLNLFTTIGISFAGSGQILVSQIVGAKRRDEIQSTIGTIFTEMLVISFAAAVLQMLFSRNIVSWMNTPEESFSSALAYLRITCVGIPLIYGYNAVCSILRGMGDSKSPLVFIAIAALFNVLGDILFVAVFPWGAAGTAIATVLAQGLSFVFSLVSLYRRRDRFGFDFKLRSFRADKRKLTIILKLGFPMALRNICITSTQMVLMGNVNLYGLTDAAAYSIGDKILHLANIFHGASSQAAGSMIGQNVGAERRDRVKSIVFYSMAIALIAAVILSGIGLLFPEAIFGLFTDDPLVLAQAPIFLLISSLTMLLSAVMGSYEAVITGTGNAALNFLGGILDGVIFRVCFSFLFAKAFNMGAAGFFLGDALARLGPILVGGIYYHSGAWTRRKTLVEQ